MNNRQKLIKLMKAYDLSKQQVSEMSGVPRETLGRYLRGDSKRLSPKNIEKLSSSLDLDPEYYFGKDENDEFVCIGNAYSEMYYYIGQNKNKLSVDEKNQLARFLLK